MLGSRMIAPTGALLAATASRSTRVYARGGLIAKRALALSLLIGGLSLADAAQQAQAATYCGPTKDAGAKTSSRYGRVRAQACLEVSGASVRAVNRTIVDKPSGCTFGVTPSGPGTTCPPSAASLWPEFHGFSLDVRQDGGGIARCSWGSNGGHALTFSCYSGWKPSRGPHNASATTCFDVKNDGAPWYCTEWASFDRTF